MRAGVGHGVLRNGQSGRRARWLDIAHSRIGARAAEDALFARMSARVDRPGIPVACLVAVGILMTALEMFALSPSLGGLFSRLVSVSTLLIIPAYLFSSSALSLDKTENRSMRLVGLAATVASILVTRLRLRSMYFPLLCSC